MTIILSSICAKNQCICFNVQCIISIFYLYIFVFVLSVVLDKIIDAVN